MNTLYDGENNLVAKNNAEVAKILKYAKDNRLGSDPIVVEILVNYTITSSDINAPILGILAQAGLSSCSFSAQKPYQMIGSVQYYTISFTI